MNGVERTKARDAERAARRAVCRYASPLGEALLFADAGGLTGLWFARAGEEAIGDDAASGAAERAVLASAKRWLDVYFSGKEPDFTPPLHLTGTPFQMEVWSMLRRIPYGATETYGALARRLAARRGLSRMAAQAVGGAVGRNPVSIIVPCHRVVGARGGLVGYGGGLDRKERLLAMEGALFSVDDGREGARGEARV